jgi:hypothetical protein
MYIINNLTKDDQNSFHRFVEENPRTLLPTELDLESNLGLTNKEDENAKEHNSHVPSFRDDESPPL